MANRWGNTLFWGAPKSLQMVNAAMKLKDDCSLKVMTNLVSILKSRDITLSTKVHIVKAMVFPVVMYGCESWTLKKAEHWRIDAFELWCWRQLWRVPWTAARQTSLPFTISQSLLKLMSIESVTPSNHPILYQPLLLLPSIFPNIRVFSNESVLHIRWPKHWDFGFNISPSNEHSGPISFRMDWLDLPAVQKLSRVFSNTTIQKHRFFGAQLSL